MSESQITTAPPGMNPSRSSFRLLVRWAALGWLSCLLSVGLLWAEHQLVILHPYAVLFLSLFAVTLASTLVCLVYGTWRTLRGPRRLRAWVWTGFGCVPMAFWTVMGVSTLKDEERNDRPKSWR